MKAKKAMVNHVFRKHTQFISFLLTKVPPLQSETVSVLLGWHIQA